MLHEVLTSDVLEKLAESSALLVPGDETKTEGFRYKYLNNLQIEQFIGII